VDDTGIERRMDQTPEAVPAHLSFAAIGIAQLERHDRPLRGRPGPQHPVCTETVVTVANGPRRRCVERKAAVQVDQYQEVVTEPYVLGKGQPTAF
jgi:hypothetical protein